MATSPTGTPVLSPKLVPWIALGMSTLAGAEVTLQQTGSHPTLATIFGATLTVLGAVLGVISPGWRNPPPAGQA